MSSDTTIAVSHDSPLWLAWVKYKETSSYANTLKWALQFQQDEGVGEGCLWASFACGWNSAILEIAPLHPPISQRLARHLSSQRAPHGSPDNLDEVLSRAGWALNDATWRYPVDCESPGWVPECRAAQKLIAEYQRRYRLGLAARPKVEDAEVANRCAQLRAISSPEASIERRAADLLERLAGELAERDAKLAAILDGTE